MIQIEVVEGAEKEADDRLWSSSQHQQMEAAEASGKVEGIYYTTVRERNGANAGRPGAPKQLVSRPARSRKSNPGVSAGGQWPDGSSPRQMDSPCCQFGFFATRMTFGACECKPF